MRDDDTGVCSDHMGMRGARESELVRACDRRLYDMARERAHVQGSVTETG